MRLTFNKNYFVLFSFMLLIEVAIAYYLKSGFIRHTFGDFLVVILLYSFFKSFLRGSTVTFAIITLGIAFIVEFLQLTDFLEYFGLEHSNWANLVFGNSFSRQDLVAYTLGIAFTVLLEKLHALLKTFGVHSQEMKKTDSNTQENLNP